MLVLGGRETIIPSELGRRPAVACRALRALMPNTVPAIALQEAAAAEEKATNTEIDREYQGNRSPHIRDKVCPSLVHASRPGRGCRKDVMWRVMDAV
jgi:hypothetical protein